MTPTTPTSISSTEDFPSRSTSTSQAIQLESEDQPQESSNSIPACTTPESNLNFPSPSSTRKRFSVDAFKFNFRNRKNSQSTSTLTGSKEKKGEKRQEKSQQVAPQPAEEEEKVNQSEERREAETNEDKADDEEGLKEEGEISEEKQPSESDAPSIPERSTSTPKKPRSSSFSNSDSSKVIIPFKFPIFGSPKQSSPQSRGRSPYSHPTHSVSVPALVTSHSKSRQELARSSGQPTRRVSFSPSIDEALDAREEALDQSKIRNGNVDLDLDPEELKSKWDKEDKKKLLKEEKEKKKLKKRESEEGKKLKVKMEVINSTDKEGKEVGELQFSWDENGIHDARGRKRRLSKAKVNKRQAIAARHARVLEHVINGGTGLSSNSPIPPPISPQQISSKKGKGKEGQQRKTQTIPLATAQELKQLKSALMDANIANGIIGELRAMKLPVQASGLHEHGERVLAIPELEDTIVEEMKSKVASEEVPASAFNLHQLHHSKSEAELALKLVSSRDANSKLQSEASAQDQAVENDKSFSTQSNKFNFGNFRKRTTSNSSTVPSFQVSSTTESHVLPVPLKACALSHSEPEAHSHHTHTRSNEMKKFKSRHEEAIKRSHEENVKNEMAAAAAIGIGGVGLWTWWNSKKQSSTVKESLESNLNPDLSINSASTIEDPNLSSTSTSTTSFPSFNLPEVPSLPYGVSPISLIMAPTSTAITASASASGAFDMMASVSGAAIRASGTDLTIQPPLDRLAIFVHWWGFEITMPKASMKFLSTAQSVSGAFMSFLSTMCLSGGVPELLPFIKYSEFQKIGCGDFESVEDNRF